MSETFEILEKTASDGASKPEYPFWVVGIGASAGGLESLERFFAKAHAKSGMAYVVVQHLSPDFKSVMDELLARQTSIPICQAKEGLALEVDTIYLIPPRKEAILSGGRFHLTDKEPKEPLSLPIDHFFRSLAADAGHRAIAVVLSGSGSDGSRGIRDVHQAGGLVLCESEETAKFDGMAANKPKRFRSSVTRPSFAAHASRGWRKSTGCPSNSTRPCGFSTAAPNKHSSNSVRPAPIRPAMPKTSPRLSSNEISLSRQARACPGQGSDKFSTRSNTSPA